MTESQQFEHKVVLIDYTAALFSPMGFEAETLAKVGASWETHLCTTEAEALEVARDADVVVVQSVRPLLTANVLPKLERARCTIRAGAGYDSIDYKVATELGIMVCNTPTYCTDDVADHTIALMLAGVRHLARLDAGMKAGGYPKLLAMPTRRVRGATLGIIGLGRIGSTVAQRVRGWEMNVISWDPVVTQERADQYGVRMVSLDEVLRTSDFITIHAPLLDSTYHLLSWDAFAKVKPGLILVNAARGPIVHEEPLVEALQDGRIWAAGLDVTEREPLPPESKLLQLDNVTLTPHVAANSPQAREDLYRIVCQISIDVVQGRIPEWVVNPDVLDHLRQVD